MYWFGFLLLLCSAAPTLGANCNAVTGDHAYCSCTMDDGSGTVDISSYANQDKSPKFSGKSGDYDYYYNPCYPVVVQGVSDCADNSAAAACQVSSDTPTKGFKIGDFAQPVFSIDPNTNNVIITYTGGDGERQVEVLLKCNPTISEPDFTANGEPNPLHYSLTLESKCSCPYKEGESCTGGGGNNPGGGGDNGSKKKSSKNDPGVVGIVLLSLALVAFISYFVIGAVILRVKYQRTGSDLIINKEFWKDFPILVKDGVVFTFSPCYKLIKERKGGYSTFK